MGKIKNAAKYLGEAAVAYSDYTKEIDQMANELMKRDRRIELTEAKLVAAVLVRSADVAWK